MSSSSSVTSSPKPPVTAPVHGSLSLSGTLSSLASPLENLRLSSSCSALPAMALLRPAVASSSSSSSSSQQVAVQKRRELLHSPKHNLRLTQFPTTERYPYVAGTSSVAALLKRNVGPIIFNGKYATGLFHNIMYISSPRCNVGIYTAVLRFCKKQNRVMSVLCYDANDWLVEPSSEFWNSVFDVAESYSPCILIIHNASQKMHEHKVQNVYEWIRNTWQQRSMRPRSAQAPVVWLLFVDRVPPWQMEREWGQFATDQVAEYTYPAPGERLRMLRNLIKLRLLDLQPLGVDLQYIKQKLNEEYRPCLEKCIRLVALNEELELGSLAAAALFVRTLFLTATRRIPTLDSEQLTVAKLKEALPNSDDFDIVIGTFQRRRVQIDVIELERLLAVNDDDDDEDDDNGKPGGTKLSSGQPPGWGAMN